MCVCVCVCVCVCAVCVGCVGVGVWVWVWVGVWVWVWMGEWVWVWVCPVTVVTHVLNVFPSFLSIGSRSGDTEEVYSEAEARHNSSGGQGEVCDMWCQRSLNKEVTF